jgi:hypothetical protein
MSASALPATTKCEETILLPGQNPAGEHIFALLLKRTYDIRPGLPCTRAEKPAKLVKGDTHYGDPKVTPLKFESDLVPFKLATDVVLIGKAHAPGGKPVEQLRPFLQVGEHHKELLVTGDRVCNFQEGGLPSFGAPVPFTEMPLTYDRAYGGVDIHSNFDLAYPYPRNPLGRGFVVKNTKRAVQDLPLPNIEDPLETLTEEGLITEDMMAWEKQPMPQGYGWYVKYCYPRALLAGVMPADRAFEREMRAVYETVVPAEQLELYRQTNLPSMDFRFFNGASPGLAVPYLEGNESVVLRHISVEGELSFALAGDRPEMEIDIGTGPFKPPVVLHTLAIRSEDQQLDLVWRGAVPYPGPDWLPNMRKLEIHID